jgi:hypothetical protein
VLLSIFRSLALNNLAALIFFDGRWTTPDGVDAPRCRYKIPMVIRIMCVEPLLISRFCLLHILSFIRLVNAITG